jgi:hypothetical protein
MDRSRLKLTCLIVAVALALPGTALAGKPYVIGNVGNGSFPTVTAGPAGVFHVVFNDPAANVFHYCQVLKGKGGCAKSVVLPFNDATPPDAAGAPGKAWIVRNEATGTLYLAHAQYVSGDTYVWTSTDGGTSFSGPVKVYGGVNGTVGTDSERPLLFPANASIAFPTFNTGLYVQDAKLDGSTAGAEATANLDQSGLGSRSYNLSLATLTSGTLATADDLERVSSWQAPNGSPLSATPSWGPPQFVTAGDDSTMDGTDTDSYLGYTTGSGGKQRFEIRKWGGLAFGAPTVIQKDPGYVADLYVSENGRPGAAFRENGLGLRYTSSKDDGKTWDTKTIAVSDEVFFGLTIARDDAGNGLAVWRRDGAIGAADLTEVADPTAPQVSKTVTKNGRTLGLNVTGSCVVPGKSTTVTTGGQGKGLLTKVRYSFGAQLETDTARPWSATFKVPATAKAGAHIPVTSLGTLKAKKKTFSIFITSSVQVCGG